ncbi:branched-chain amino acid ABC transporter permease [Leucobacter aridicollis]|uniref:Branched-chain amino acid transport system permease protein n=2 Tax=Leucobacter aridicollis TaxID=283878 RepID=A0A852R2U8_9MICO|nr:branched-chain amino acid ABC transporter permease [Leucobacter aridicollis]MBL3681957.1 branched-chain amino acid ABC transporter permease [Leucobacter aridicollis]NYD26997.1 branched-chain amino acid transport system permease protein [Leucobacter aridicollis]
MLWRAPAIALLALILGFVGLSLQALPAHAATCVPDATTGCVQGIVKTSAGDPASGVGLTLTGKGASEDTTTDENGRWSFPITQEGTYEVALDTATLPEGQFPRATDTRSVEVALFESASALFPLTDDPDAAATPTAPGSGETAGSGSGEATPGDDEATTTTKPSATNAFSWPRFWQQAASGLRMGLLLALGAVGLSLVFGTTGLSNFAHAEMLSMGGILAFLAMQLTGNIWLSGALVVVVMAAFGWVQDAVLWKPLRKRRLSLTQMMIVSIGFSIVLQNIFQFFFGANILRIDPSTPKTVTLAGITLTVQSYVAMGIALVAIIAVALVMKYTRFGRATRAVADNRPLAEASGIDVDRVIRSVWTVGVALAGLSGVLLGLVLNGIAWNTGWHYLLLLFAAVILGGIGTTFGAIVGALIIGLVIEMANIWLPGDLKHAAALLILIVVLLVRPQGLFGRKERIG